MTLSNLFLFFVAVIVSIALAYYQYLHKVSIPKKVAYTLLVLRSLSYSLVFLLLINPVFSKKTVEITKMPLIIGIDNSESISYLKAQKKAQQIAQQLSHTKELSDKFSVIVHPFDAQIINQKANFLGTQTRIDIFGKQIGQLYRQKQYPIILLTDGNQTIGEDYVYSFKQNAQLYPVVLGDTTAIFDCRIGNVNYNKIAFYKNKFPVEIFVHKQGKQATNLTVTITQGGTTVYSQNIPFTASETTKTITALLEASKTGWLTYTINLKSSIAEKNKANNTKPFAIEVIDQRSEIAIVTQVNHPDIGVFKRSIEQNAQYKCTVTSPTNNTWDNYTQFVLYQPDASFEKLFEYLNKAKKNIFIVTGTQTDYNFLNRFETEFTFNFTSQKEEYYPVVNPEFGLFTQPNVNLNQLPPLQNRFGTLQSSNQVQALLWAKVNGIDLKQPLLAFAETNGTRKAYCFGENIWKWRMQSHVLSKSFENFDTFLGNIIQYITSKSNSSPLQITAEQFYNFGEPIIIQAQFFDKNLIPDPNASLSIQLFNKQTNQSKTYDFIQKNNFYETTFQNLPVGKYSYKVSEKKSGTQANGQFQILNFNAEHQFVSSNYNKLNQLAEQNLGKVYYPDQVNTLIQQLLQENTYPAVEKEVQKQIPLIDWKSLLILLLLLLITEWFVRKYNGLL